MFKTLRRIATALLATVTGCGPQGVSHVPTAASQVRGDSIVTPILKELLEEHGVPTRTDGHWLVAENGIRMAGALVKEYPAPSGEARVQLDFYLVLKDDRLLVESFGGLGATKDDAVKDGLQCFTSGSFHVLLSVFFNAIASDQVEIENWEIAGKTRRVTLGDIYFRKLTDVPFEPPTDWFSVVQRAIEKTDLPSGTHWFRCYYAQFDKKPGAVEVLLDNDDWHPIIEAMSNIEWPVVDRFYSVRVFAVIQDHE